MTSDQAPAAVQLLHGAASDEELAAVLAVLPAAGDEPTPRPAAHPSQWAAPARAVRAPLIPGPGAWRASAGPR